MIRWLSLAVLAPCVLTSSGLAATYEVRIDNQIPGGPETGNPFTPPVAVVHDGGYSLFAPGAMASPGVEALARDGVTGDLEGEVTGHPSVFDTFVGDSPFFDSVTFEVEGDPGQLFSVVTMLARSNDLITGVHDVMLPGSGSVMFEPITVYDAGVEENTGLVAHIPFYGNTFVGPDEDAPITMITSYSVIDDPVHGELRFEFPPSGKVTITLLEATPTVSRTWGAIKNLYR